MVATLLLLAGCGGDDRKHPASDESRVECALAGATAFERTCHLERVQGNAGLQLVIRHPDGGFRRFNVLTDGRGVEVADGAEPASVTLIGTDRVEVRVGDDRYRLPATSRAQPDAPQS